MPRERTSTKSPSLTERDKEAADLLDAIEEARRRIGVRRARRLKKMWQFKSGKSKPIRNVKKIHRPWRVGNVHNRHR